MAKKVTKKKKLAAKTKAKAKAKAKPKHTKKTARPPERRKFKRIAVKNLWVVELRGDYQFVAQAQDLSEGGIFLKGHLKTSDMPSKIRIPLGNQTVEVAAIAVRDQISKSNYGTGYQFVGVSKELSKSLRRVISEARS